MLARQEVLIAPSAIPCSLSLLISCIHSSLFLDWRRTFSLKFFDTQFPLISREELVLPHHAHCVFSSLYCNRHSLLLSSCLFKIRGIENPSCSTYELFALLALLQLFVSLRPLVQVLGSRLASGAPWSSAMSHLSEGVGQQQQKQV